MDWTDGQVSAALFDARTKGVLEFARAILHGSEVHRAWLLRASEEFANDGCVTAPSVDAITAQPEGEAETPAEVVKRLGIDVPKWAAEIRAKVAALPVCSCGANTVCAGLNGPPPHAPGCAAFPKVTSRTGTIDAAPEPPREAELDLTFDEICEMSCFAPNRESVLRCEPLMRGQGEGRRLGDVTQTNEKRWWVSWQCVAAGFELHSPWWESGYVMAFDENGEDIDVPTYCAAVAADDEVGAKEQILRAYDAAPIRLEWRFCNERDPVWSPFGERFQKAKWMQWPPVQSQ